MKSFLLLGIVIYCIISCSNAVASDDTDRDESSSDEDDDDAEFRDCASQYLKLNGKLDDEVSSTRDSQWCLFTISILVANLRETYEAKVKKDMPDEVTCITNQFERDQIFDFVVKLRYIQGNDKISEAEQKTALDNIRKIFDEKMKATANLCGGDDNKLQALIQDEFESAEEETA